MGTPYFWSEWRDLNSRPLDPQSSALPTAPHPDISAAAIAAANDIIARCFAKSKHYFCFFTKKFTFFPSNGDFSLYWIIFCAILTQLTGRNTAYTPKKGSENYGKT